MFIRYMVPIDETHCRAFLFSTRRVSGLGAMLYRIYYHLWASWSLLKLFIGQDTVVFAAQDYDAPEQLSAPDNGIIKWRRIIANHAASERGEGLASESPSPRGPSEPQTYTNPKVELLANDE
jgi:hypothetical protein